MDIEKINTSLDTETKATEALKYVFKKDSKTEIIELKYAPKQAVSVLIPVCVCMLITIISVLLTKITLGINKGRESQLDSEGFKHKFETHDKDSMITPLQTLYICIFYVASLVVMTFVILLIIYMNWIKLLTGILSVTIVGLFLFVSFLFCLTITAAFGLTIDLITSLIFILNNAALAFFGIMWSAPRVLNQIYQIQLAVLIAWYLDTLTPIWLGWLLLIILSLWDLVAVLPSYGPLNLIIKILNERGQTLPSALVYSIYFDWPAVRKLSNFVKPNTSESLKHKLSALINANNNNSNINNIGINSEIIEYKEKTDEAAAETTKTIEEIKDTEEIEPMIKKEDSIIAQIETEEEEDDGPKLGLGDFVFYSLLIAKAATQLNLTTIIACYLSIVIGLTITISLVAYLSRPLPALPISIFIAIAIFFSNEYTVVPFCNRLSLNQIFI